MSAFECVLKTGKHEVKYTFRRNDQRPGHWAAWKLGAIDPYLINLLACTCTCQAGKYGRRCKHLTEALKLESEMSTATPTATPASTPASIAQPVHTGTTLVMSQTSAPVGADALAALIVRGDLGGFSDAEKATYYLAVCHACDLDPATRPFEFLRLGGKTILYAMKSCSEQLRKRDRVSLKITSQREESGIFIVTAEATMPDGRIDTDIGAVMIQGLQGEARANAMMKTVTKAKRRVTLSICGMGMLDESEVDSIPVHAAVTHAEPNRITQVPPPAPIPTPALSASLPAVVSPVPAGMGLDRNKLREQVVLMVDALKIKDFSLNLNKAYGKGLLEDLTDAELTDLHRRLTAKLPAKVA